MKFGIYAPIPMATVGSREIAQSAAQAQYPLPDGLRDVQYEYGSDLLIAADAVGLIFAFRRASSWRRSFGLDLASAVASRFERMRASWRFIRALSIR